MIKHKFFTCHCGSDKCRYSRTNITNFLREYYKRNGEPLPDELTPKNENDVKTTEAQSAKKQCSTKTSVSFSSFLLNSQDGFLKGNARQGKLLLPHGQNGSPTLLVAQKAISISCIQNSD